MSDLDTLACSLSEFRRGFLTNVDTKVDDDKRELVSAEDFIFRYTFTLDPHDKKMPIKRFPYSDWVKNAIRIWEEEDLILVVKSRQMMASWLYVALHLWDAMFHKGRTIFFVSKKESDSGFDNQLSLLARAQFIYDRLPESMKTKMTKNLKPPKLEFPELHSSIMAMSQDSEGLRQYTASRILSDEMAFQERAEKAYIAMKPTIDGGGALTGISTPNGRNNLFYFLVNDVQRGKKSAPGEDLIVGDNKSRMETLCHGLGLRRNRNGYCVLSLHYSADARKTKEWKEKSMKSYSSTDSWAQEQELDFNKTEGTRVFPGFRFDTHVKKIQYNPYRTIWRGWDFGYNHPACLTKGNRVLASNLRWVPVESLLVGDEILAFDENSGKGSGNSRCWKKAVVEKTGIFKKDCFKITLSDGTSFTCSEEHPFLALTRTHKDGRARRYDWIAAANLKIGTQLPKLITPWRDPETYDAGWVSGFYDGEGSLSIKKDSQIIISLAQVYNGLMFRLRNILETCGFKYCLCSHKETRLNHKDVERITILGGFAEHIRFLGMFRPFRLLRKFCGFPLTKGPHLQRESLVSVEKIESAGMQEVVSLQTSSRTYIAEGFGHHNCVWVQMDDDGGLSVLHELLGEEILIDHFAEEVKKISRNLFPACDFKDAGDPAGRAITDKSERTTIDILRSCGIRVNMRKRPVKDGIAVMRALLVPRGDNKVQFQIDPAGCPILIDGYLGGYVRDEDDEAIKDGFYEHLFDALRYFINVNYDPKSYKPYQLPKVYIPRIY